MSLILTSDSSRPGGGYAILKTDGAVAPVSLAIEDRSSGLFLAPGGKWTKHPHYFDVEKVDPTSARLGPEIVDHVEADTILALHGEGAGLLGVQVWPSIRPSAGASSGYVMPNRVEMEVASIVGNMALTPSNAAASAPPAPPPAPPTAAQFEELPPLPPPPTPSVEPLAPPPAAPTGGSGFLKPLLIVNGAVLLILFLVFFRGTDAAKELVCEANSPLAGLGVAKILASCPEKVAADPEAKAYAEYLQCLPGKPVCAQKNCADAYLSTFPSGGHAEQVRAAAMDSQRSCSADADKKTAADTFAAFNECLRTTLNICSRSQCVDRYRYKLTIEPYASSLRQSAETAANDCRRQQEEAGFAEFNRCVAGAAACDTARCASAFTSAYPTSTYVSKVLQTAEYAARTCAAQQPVAPQPAPQPAPPQSSSAEDATRKFIARFYYVSGSQGEASGLNNLYASEVNFYGKQRNIAAVMKDKYDYYRRWDSRQFYLKNDSVSISCNSNGQVCRATGEVEYVQSSSLLGKNARGLAYFDFLVANSETNPRIISEFSRVEQHY